MNETTNEVSRRDLEYGSESSPQRLREYKRLSEKSCSYVLYAVQNSQYNIKEGEIKRRSLDEQAYD